MQRLASIAITISMRLPEKPAPYNIVAQLPLRHLKEIREALESAGVDWRAQCKAYRKFVNDAAKVER